MNQKAPQANGLPGILAGADLPDPARAIAAWQEHCRRLLRTDIDLGELEVAQGQYRDVLTMLAETLPFHQWLQWRPRHLKPRYYREWIEALQGMVEELEREFSMALLTASPPISTQRQRPQ